MGPVKRPHPAVERPSSQGFATTRWSLVLLAGEGGAPARQALESLCRTYWYPLYAYLRRRGHSAEDGADLTQGFFARFLEKNYLQAVRPERGRFRSYLLAALKHFLENERKGREALKRGGGRPLLGLELAGAESRYRFEPSHDLTPERVFERRWALTLLDQVVGRLREEFARAGKPALFDRLKFSLTGEAAPMPYRDLAAQLALSEGALKVAIHRLRRRYRELLREEIGHTVADPAEIEDEIRHLFDAVAH
jgi:DNA-directed RNA polymerase specialized sigma24 family protein